VCEIGGVVKMYFALADDEEIEDYAEWLVDVLAHLRKWVDGDGNALWDGVEPAAWRPATQDEYDDYSRDPIDHLVSGVGLPTVSGCLN